LQACNEADIFPGNIAIWRQMMTSSTGFGSRTCPFTHTTLSRPFRNAPNALNFYFSEDRGSHRFGSDQFRYFQHADLPVQYSWSMPFTRVIRKIVSGTYSVKFHQKINVRRGRVKDLKCARPTKTPAIEIVSFHLPTGLCKSLCTLAFPLFHSWCMSHTTSPIRVFSPSSL
jgi:hypothetical protein